MIDFRSDTVTLPSDEMRQAMARACVGDDVYGEDPTVNDLELTSAKIVGKEAALFVPSGTMGNQIAILTHTKRGDEVIVDALSHIVMYEVGAASMFAGVQLHPVPGLLQENTINKLYKAYRQPNVHFPTSRLLCMENTFNMGSGTVMPSNEMKAVYETAKDLSLFVHLDGARIFNAAVALDCDVKELTASCDSVMFCLSKGLGAPVGSILAGSKEFINDARKYRKSLGGGMRQAGILAAAGLISLKMINRLAIDHDNALLLAQNLSTLDGFKINLALVQTNIVFVDITDTKLDTTIFLNQMFDFGIKAGAVKPGLIRFVTHKDVSRADILKAVEAIERIVAQS